MDHLHRSLLNTFSAQPLDRVAHKRKNSDWLATQLADSRAEFLILNEHEIVTKNDVPVIISQNQFNSLELITIPLLLGIKHTDGTPVFIVNLIKPEEELAELFKTLQTSTHAKDDQIIQSVSLRGLSQVMGPELSSIYSYALILNHWHLTTRFCTRCGSALAIKEGGIMQQCTHDACAHIEYPRINPAVIMRVTKDDKLLLGRQENWPETMYSVLAGFVEVGETLEHAVEREVMEEVNLAVHDINYHSSQPWPFPNSIMLGYTAEANSFEIDWSQDEIEHAVWLSAEELKENIKTGTISAPREISISYRLIDDWFETQTGTSLKAFIATLPD